jgi:hypothetical protein
LKGRFNESKIDDDSSAEQRHLPVLEIRDGSSRQSSAGVNALNEKLRDDFIKDVIAGVGRWNRIIDKSGIRRGSRSRTRRSIAGSVRWPRRSRSRRQCRVGGRMGGQSRSLAAERCRPRVRRVADGTRRRTGPVCQLDCAAAARDQ